MERPLGGRAALSDSTADTETLVSRSRSLTDVSPCDLLDCTVRPLVRWRAPDGIDVVGCGEAARLRATGLDRFDSVRTQASTVFERIAHDGPAIARPRAFGGFAFHDDRSPPSSSPWNGFDRAQFVIPRVQLTETTGETWLTVVDAPESIDDAIRSWHDRVTDGTIDREPDRSLGETASGHPAVVDSVRSTEIGEWRDQIEAAIADIESTPLEKIVLAQARTNDLDRPIRLAATLAQLGRRYPDCYRFAFSGLGSATFFGVPPERLVAKTDERIDTEALAGSAPRGSLPATDETYASHLETSQKITNEHELVVESIERQLEPLADRIDVGDRRVKRLATIQHLRTPISGTLAGERHVLDVVEALHPTPAVGGVPQQRALDAIRSIESFDRGWYAAPVGWFDADGDGEFAVAIRSGVAADRRITLFAGNGIVAGSDPDAEWDEVELKFKPILEELR
ncbi:isochorismate synthase [Halovivax gelatinilyticus]|uniref:isochorismate synthase n=1 Tax=Halovivax gelatinilyticus TaxID=2961597 RepID=UPI0020CA7CA4|nr:isochorismate synthase [Halovivax gelatinilyticus]